MARTATQNVKLAREIVAGDRSRSVPELVALAHALAEENHIGYARRIYHVALSLAPAEVRDGIQKDLALTTSKDPDLPVDDRLRSAEGLLMDLLVRAASLPQALHQETLGILGGVYKQRWSVYGHKDILEKAVHHYRLGYRMGIRSDLGYTALNTAFVLDLLADAERGVSLQPDDGCRSRTEEAARIRSEIVAELPALRRDDAPRDHKWWFECTLVEAYLGLRRYDEARACVERAAAYRPDNWRLEATIRQMAHIVRMQCKADGLPLERWSSAPGFAILADLLGGSPAAALSFFLGKVGLALSGGGFRASLYHIGVLARLAEIDMLRHVEVISCVSGGSILGTYYYLELRHLLQTKRDAEITREDYIHIVKNVEANFLAGVQRNIRLRMILEPGSNWKVLSSRASTTTDRLADLYERELYSRVNDEFHGKPERYIQDLLVHPADLPPDAVFAPRYDNWSRLNKVPILILNATALNTCHNWQFTATYMGEPPLRAIDIKIDANDRLRRVYYGDAPARFRRLRLGQAVAASSCVPGLFDPLVVEPLYPGYAAKLVDGGVYDNQGVASLLGEDCTVLLISDACGQTALDKAPGSERIGVSVRSNYVLMARSRQEQYQLLSALRDAGLLRGVAYVHLKRGLDGQPVDWIDCSDPSHPEHPTPLTSYGIRKDIQAALAAIRTDLDAFSDAEADALMLSGYRMMREEVQACIHGFPLVNADPADWRFLAMEKLASALGPTPALEQFKAALCIAQSTTFKAYRASIGVRLTVWITFAAVLTAFVDFILSVRGESVSVSGLALACAAVISGLIAARFLLHRVVRNPNPLWQILIAIPLLVLGGPLTWVCTRLLDPAYLHSFPVYANSPKLKGNHEH